MSDETDGHTQPQGEDPKPDAGTQGHTQPQGEPKAGGGDETDGHTQPQGEDPDEA